MRSKLNKKIRVYSTKHIPKEITIENSKEKLIEHQKELSYPLSLLQSFYKGLIDFLKINISFIKDLYFSFKPLISTIFFESVLVIRTVFQDVVYPIFSFKSLYRFIFISIFFTKIILTFFNFIPFDLSPAFVVSLREYMLFIETLADNCSNFVKDILQTGKLSREVSELRDQIDHIRSDASNRELDLVDKFIESESNLFKLYLEKETEIIKDANEVRCDLDIERNKSAKLSALNDSLMEELKDKKVTTQYEELFRILSLIASCLSSLINVGNLVVAASQYWGGGNSGGLTREEWETIRDRVGDLHHQLEVGQRQNMSDLSAGRASGTVAPVTTSVVPFSSLPRGTG